MFQLHNCPIFKLFSRIIEMIDTHPCINGRPLQRVSRLVVVIQTRRQITVINGIVKKGFIGWVFRVIYPILILIVVAKTCLRELTLMPTYLYAQTNKMLFSDFELVRTAQL